MQPRTSRLFLDQLSKLWDGLFIECLIPRLFRLRLRLKCVKLVQQLLVWFICPVCEPIRSPAARLRR